MAAIQWNVAIAYMSTYTKINIHIVFATKHREALIQPEWKDELHQYITGIITNKEQKLLAINSMPDHIHIFIGHRPNSMLSDLVKDIKVASTGFIRSRGFCKTFRWQEGFGAFSHSPSQIKNVVRYIRTQEIHHSNRTFKEEMMKTLKDFNVEYNEYDLKAWFG